MNSPEVFSQLRMNRCVEIYRAIMDRWQQANSLEYVIRATEPVSGITLDDLRKQHFMIGVGSDLSKVMLADVLVVISLIEQEHAALKARKGSMPERFTETYHISTEFSDEEVIRLLSQVEIETPFDQGKGLRFEAKYLPRDEEENRQS